MAKLIKPKLTEEEYKAILAEVHPQTRKRAYSLAFDAYYAAGSAWIKSGRESDGLNEFIMEAIVNRLIVDGWRKVKG